LTEHHRLQEHPKTAIYNGIDNRNVALPIQVFHPVFQEFLDRINDPGFHPKLEIVRAASDFMFSTSQMYSNAVYAWDELRPSLRQLLNRDVNPRDARLSHLPSGLVETVVENTEVPLLCIEYQRGFCEGSRDPEIQAAYSLRALLVAEKVYDFPTFLNLY
jgi:hypothetical protein